ncbi:helix-turn-helix domain-containing protein [Erwinia rhapontici]|uniref:helix-turn-helix domain-containing protein n=1 Tax=Erwinia rhapontici TaxID=55212 RepID=UPI00105F2819|nr:helix-turn-helix domain-containing protein [Erwinia rhapontici]TDT01661.1 ArsR family transcriptional regulator [Erwinia rhapontici]
MSMELMVKAMKIRVGNPLRKLVLLKLADNASDKGECWPSLRYIAEQCEISRRSVINHIDALCESGLMKKELRPGVKGNSSNLYYLSLDGAGYSPGGSAGAAPHSAARSPGSAGDSPGGSAGAAPRISQSFEPVKEPVIEPKDIGAQAEARTPAKRSSQEYSPEFESAWQAYPKRAGANNKSAAGKAWAARIKSGVSAAAMLAGVQRYAAFVIATGKSGTEYVKQAATFFGPDHHFDEPWDVPAAPQRQTSSQHKHSGFDSRDYGKTQAPAWGRGNQ